MKTLSKLSFIFILVGALGFAQSQNPSAPPNQGPPPHHHMMGMGPGMPMGMGIPPGDWWKNSDIAQQINLTDAQTQQLSQIFTNHRAAFIQLRGNVENDEGKLRDLLDQDQPQQEQVLAQLGQLQADRNALETDFAKMSLEFRGKLTPDQWKKLRSVAKEHMMQFGRHRGGPGGPGQGAPPPPQ